MEKKKIKKKKKERGVPDVTIDLPAEALCKNN